VIAPHGQLRGTDHIFRSLQFSVEILEGAAEILFLFGGQRSISKPINRLYEVTYNGISAGNRPAKSGFDRFSLSFECAWVRSPDPGAMLFQKFAQSLKGRPRCLSALPVGFQFVQEPSNRAGGRAH
jgi:hypothetical protein